jgi:hypothetical protein
VHSSAEEWANTSKQARERFTNTYDIVEEENESLNAYLSEEEEKIVHFFVIYIFVFHSQSQFAVIARATNSKHALEQNRAIRKKKDSKWNNKNIVF